MLSSSQPSKKQAKLTPTEKLSIKKNTLLHKVLLLSLHKESSTTTSAINGGGSLLNLNLTFENYQKGEWDISHIAEILATRLSYAKNDSRLDGAANKGGNDLILYLGGCYARAWGEWKEVVERKKRNKNGGGEGVEEELESILVEMRSQVREIDFMIDVCVCVFVVDMY